MTEQADSVTAKRYTRLGHMALAITIGVSVAGFLIGVRERPTPQRLAVVASHQATETQGHSAQKSSAIDKIPVVVGYAEMSRVRRGPNANWANRLPPRQDDPTAFYGAAPSSTEQRSKAVVIRNERRAFSGAPPVVPHAIDERNPQACLVCHGTGLKVGTIVAPKMSHQFLTNCIQCHVESEQNFPGALGAERLASSSFIGLSEPGVGERAGPGAPPTIPHALWMRSECSSCHGSLSDEGLRSSHPWRTNCTQCHAPSRDLDWSPLAQPLSKPSSREPSVNENDANESLVRVPIL